MTTIYRISIPTCSVRLALKGTYVLGLCLVLNVFAERTWYEVRPDFGTIWLEKGESTVKSFSLDIPMENVTGVGFFTQSSCSPASDNVSVVFNDGTPVFIPGGPHPAVHFSEVEVPVGDLRQGANSVRFSIRDRCVHFNQRNYILRCYFDRDNAPAGDGASGAPSIAFTPPTRQLGDIVDLAADVSPPDGAEITRVEYYLRAEVYPKDPLHTGSPLWHRIGVSTTPPYTVQWPTRLVPDQDGMAMKAVVYADNGYTAESDSVGNMSFQRTVSTTRYVLEPYTKITWFSTASSPERQVHSCTLPALPERPVAAFLGVYIWRHNSDYWTDGPLGAVEVNGKNSYPLDVNREPPEEWLGYVETDHGDWREGGNELTFTTTGSGRGYTLSHPAPVLFWVAQESGTRAGRREAGAAHPVAADMFPHGAARMYSMRGQSISVETGGQPLRGRGESATGGAGIYLLRFPTGRMERVFR